MVQQIKEEGKKQQRQKQFSNNNLGTTTIPWIEKLLQTPINDYRKNAVALSLVPYLINIKKLSYDDAFSIIKEWLYKCNGKRRLDFNLNYHIRYNLRYAKSKGYRPLKLETLKEKNRELYDILVR